MKLVFELLVPLLWVATLAWCIYNLGYLNAHSEILDQERKQRTDSEGKEK